MRPSVDRRGFSLVEVVLALGVVAFAMVGIMGLFPVAMRLALESHRETRATLIARQIIADLQTSPATHLLIARGTDLANSASFVSPAPSLGNAWALTNSYDDAGKPVGDGVQDGASFLAVVQNTPNTPLPGLARVQVNVVPAQAANPTTNTFVTLLRQ